MRALSLSLSIFRVPNKGIESIAYKIYAPTKDDRLALMGYNTIQES